MTFSSLLLLPCVCFCLAFQIGPITGSPELFPTANVAQQQLEQKETPWRDNSVSVLNFDKCEENRQTARQFKDWLKANPPPPEGQQDTRWPPLVEQPASTLDDSALVDVVVGPQFRFAWVLLLDDPSSAFWMQYTMATLVTIQSIWATNTKAEVQRATFGVCLLCGLACRSTKRRYCCWCCFCRRCCCCAD